MGRERGGGRKQESDQVGRRRGCKLMTYRRSGHAIDNGVFRTNFWASRNWPRPNLMGVRMCEESEKRKRECE